MEKYTKKRSPENYKNDKKRSSLTTYQNILPGLNAQDSVELLCKVHYEWVGEKKKKEDTDLRNSGGFFKSVGQSLKKRHLNLYLTP